MRKFIVLAIALICAITGFAQKEVTKFLGFPVDGTKSEMIRNLKSKGFKTFSFEGEDILEGRFNGNNVRVYISTENGKVSRVMVCDENTISETDIKIRFNKLCHQFKENGNYISLNDYTIPEDENISYEMIVNKKRYEAAFYQKIDGELSADDLMNGDFFNRSVWFIIAEAYGKYYIAMYYDNEYNRANGEEL